LRRGTSALLGALERFDPARGVGFRSSPPGHPGAMLDHLRHLDWAPRSVRNEITAGRVSERVMLGLQANVIDPVAAEPLRCAQRSEFRDVVAGLPGPMRAVIEGLYFAHETQAALGERLALSEGRIGQIHGRALKLLRLRLKGSENWEV